MSEIDVDNLLRKLHLQTRRKIIRRLLSGNDTQCFSTRQYAELMFAEVMFLYENDQELAREQLREEGLIEVKPDVWGMT